MGATTSRRLTARSRGLSDISNISRGSFNSNANPNSNYRGFLDSNFTDMNRSQRRQAPPPPINVSLSQRNDGFVRFLQQHASPSHHRVTAGGRIVPAGPTSPPPMLDYNSLNGLVRERAAATENPQKVVHSLSYPPKSKEGQPQTRYPANGSQPVMTQETTAYGYQPFVSMQMPAGIAALGAFPDGSTLVSMNGVSYRTYWNGMSTVMEPLQSMQLPTEQIDYGLTYPRSGSNVASYGVPMMSSQFSHMPMPLMNFTNSSQSQGSNRKTGDFAAYAASTDNEKELKMQLTNLDKHLALYHFDILPAERAELIVHRRFLVEAIDKIRVSKEKGNHSIPIIAPDTRLPVTPVQSGKGLSPAAPPFVPGSICAQSSENSAKQNLKNIANAAIARKDKALNAHEQGWNKRVTSHSHRDCSSSSVLDPSDPAMRVVNHWDIEYAGRYLYNWDLGKKVYCTTVAEFQEAVKQVREQARRYGCLGGQSKDPAYDAEQDLWWAICDRDPIPLPPSIPDYVSNPRPWNWEDSVFNFRQKGAPSGRGVEDARRSPRLMGWDPAITDSMKDSIDVSRSYYALQGQLPSVRFRTWAYDRKGKKVAIESELESGSAAKARFEPAIAHHGLEKASPKTAITPSRILQTLSTNEINGRDTNQVTNSQAKDGKKSRITEGEDMLQSTSKPLDLSPQPARLDTRIKRSLTSYLTKASMAMEDNSKHSAMPPRPFQPCVEDHPDTPARRPSSHQAEQTQSPKENLTNTFPAVKHASEAPIDSRHCVIDPSWDPVWMGEYPIYDPRNPHHAQTTTLDQRQQPAEKRSQSGPERDSQSPNSGDLTAKNAKIGVYAKYGEQSKTAKVNLPLASVPHSPVSTSKQQHKPRSIDTTK